MSAPPSYLICSKCGLEHHLNLGQNYYSYKLEDDEKILASTEFGWCFNCNKVVRILVGFSNSKIKEDIKILELKLKKEKKKRDKESIKYQIRENRKILELLKGKSSKHKCLECDSLDVVLFSENDYIHPKCNGKFKRYSDESGIRLHYKKKEIFVNPEFYFEENVPKFSYRLLKEQYTGRKFGELVLHQIKQKKYKVDDAISELLQDIHPQMVDTTISFIDTILNNFTLLKEFWTQDCDEAIELYMKATKAEAKKQNITVDDDYAFETFNLIVLSLAKKAIENKKVMKFLKKSIRKFWA